MTELLTAAQMRAIEQAAIASGEVTGLELMERAGQGVVDAIFEEWPELDRRGASPSRSLGYLQPDEEDRLRAVVLCGPGNNGGDGFVVARLLYELGWEVWVFLYGDPERLPPDARVNYERCCEANPVRSYSCLSAPEDLFDLAADIFIDALFGTGLSREIDSEDSDLQVFLRFANAWILDQGPKTVAVDIPSGLCSDSGRVLGYSMCAALTVTFHTAKVGHFLCTDSHSGASGALLCKTVVVKDIGLPSAARGPIKLVAEVRNRLPDCQRQTVWTLDGVSRGDVEKPKWSSHKYSHGHALILSGGAGKTGAARLAARGALRIGAGLVTLGVPPAAQMEVASQITALMMRRVEGAEGLAEALQDQRLNALCLGPGLGLERALALVPVALAAQRATVLDADALTAFGEDPGQLFDLLHPACVLTPHGGEFARLFPDIAEKLTAAPTVGPAYSKVDATRAAARRAGCVVLFKGPDTVIADPKGRCSINAAMYERAAPWLATAGSGDVLAGFITGLLARGIGPMQVAESAAWLHVECARQFGPGLIAEDLPEQLPEVLRGIDG